MTELAPITAALEDELQRELRDRGIVVWLDRDGHYAPYVDEIGGMEVCRFRYLAFCLRPSRAEDFVDRPQALAPAFAALMKSDWDPVEKKLRCLRAISRRDVDAALRAGEDRRCVCRIGRD